MSVYRKPSFSQKASSLFGLRPEKGPRKPNLAPPHPHAPPNKIINHKIDAVLINRETGSTATSPAALVNSPEDPLDAAAAVAATVPGTASRNDGHSTAVNGKDEQHSTSSHNITPTKSVLQPTTTHGNGHDIRVLASENDVFYDEEDEGDVNEKLLVRDVDDDENQVNYLLPVVPPTPARPVNGNGLAAAHSETSSLAPSSTNGHDFVPLDNSEEPVSAATGESLQSSSASSSAQPIPISTVTSSENPLPATEVTPASPSADGDSAMLSPSAGTTPLTLTPTDTSTSIGSKAPSPSKKKGLFGTLGRKSKEKDPPRPSSFTPNPLTQGPEISPSMKIDRAKQTERSSLLQTCMELGVEIWDIAPDGHCLFAAVADQLTILKVLTDEENNPQTTRNAAATYMEHNADSFLPFLLATPDPNFPEGECDGMMTEAGYAMYCKKIRESTEWGGEPEILALSRYYQIPIHVVQSGQPSIVQHSPDPKAKSVLDVKNARKIRAVRISYHRRLYGLGEHYNSLRKITFTMSAFSGMTMVPM